MFVRVRDQAVGSVKGSVALTTSEGRLGVRHDGGDHCAEEAGCGADVADLGGREGEDDGRVAKPLDGGGRMLEDAAVVAIVACL